MSALRVLVRPAAFAGTVLAALLATILIATPAFADVRSSINFVSGDFVANHPKGFISTVTNTDNVPHKVRRVISLRMNGLSSGAVHLTRQDGSELALQSVGGSTLQAVDQSFTLDASSTRRGTVNIGAYTLLFTNQAPSGRATLGVEVREGDKRLANASRSITVKGGLNAATPRQTLSPEPSISGDPVEAILGQDGTLPPLSDDRPVPRTDGGMPWFLYVFGGILVAGGGGLMYWLWQSRRADAAVHLGVPAQALYGRPRRDPTVHAPTMILPVVRNPYVDDAPTVAQRRSGPPVP
ncbi:MAG: hypothetical protein ACM30G_15420 [Micromonosporaceae bacterium]